MRPKIWIFDVWLQCDRRFCNGGLTHKIKKKDTKIAHEYDEIFLKLLIMTPSSEPRKSSKDSKLACHEASQEKIKIN